MPSNAPERERYLGENVVDVKKEGHTALELAMEHDPGGPGKFIAMQNSILIALDRNIRDQNARIIQLLEDISAKVEAAK